MPTKPALLCNPPAHRTNPLHRAEFRPNTTTPSFYHSIPHQLDHLPLYNRFVCKPFQMRIQFRRFPEISECPLLARKLAAPSSRAFPSAAPRRLSSDERNASLPTARGESWVHFGFLFEHLCEKNLSCCLTCFMLQNQSSPQTLFLYNIHFITFYGNKLVSIKRFAGVLPCTVTTARPECTSGKASTVSLAQS